MENGDRSARLHYLRRRNQSPRARYNPFVLVRPFIPAHQRFADHATRATGRSRVAVFQLAKTGQETSGSASVGAGIGGMASAAKGAAANSMKNAFGLRAAAARGQQAAWAAGGSGGAASAASAPGGTAGDGAPPAWAQKLQGAQASRHRRQMAIHAIRDGDKGGAGANPDIKERD